MTDAVQLSEAEFLQTEEFISRTPRGRAFLREHTRRAQTGLAEEVRNLIAELRDLWRQQSESTSIANRVAVLRHELQDMSASISHARREIAAIKPSGGNDRISSATNELDAIIVSTERASTEILEAAERVMDLLGKLRGGGDIQALATDIENEMMSVFTACSFQDLTGQRTTKVINVLRYIEQRVTSLIALWGVSAEDASDAPGEPKDTRPDAHLLHGPSFDGVDQGEIDRLMAGGAPSAAAPAAKPAAPSAPGPAPAKPAGSAGGEPDLSGLDQSAIDSLFG